MNFKIRERLAKQVNSDGALTKENGGGKTFPHKHFGDITNKLEQMKTIENDYKEKMAKVFQGKKSYLESLDNQHKHIVHLITRRMETHTIKGYCQNSRQN